MSVVFSALNEFIILNMGLKVIVELGLPKPKNRSRLGLKTNVENDVFRSK